MVKDTQSEITPAKSTRTSSSTAPAIEHAGADALQVSFKKSAAKAGAEPCANIMAATFAEHGTGVTGQDRDDMDAMFMAQSEADAAQAEDSTPPGQQRAQ